MKRISILWLCGCFVISSNLYAATLDIDQRRSRVQVDAEATGHNFTGTLEKYNATVAGDATTLTPESFLMNWSFKDLDTDDEKRNKEMMHWLGEQDPKGSFQFIKSWTDSSGAQHGMGTLTIHGVSKTISFPFTVSKEGEWVTIDGKVSMNYQHFELPLIRAMAVMTVDPKLTVRFHLVGKIK
jgi:polyisoprenoid-binding protein YceI